MVVSEWLALLQLTTLVVVIGRFTFFFFLYIIVVPKLVLFVWMTSLGKLFAVYAIMLRNHLCLNSNAKFVYSLMDNSFWKQLFCGVSRFSCYLYFCSVQQILLIFFYITHKCVGRFELDCQV